MKLVQRIIDGERVDPFETVRVNKNGDLIPVLVTLSGIQNESGKLVGVSKIVHDITKEKKLEEARLQFVALTHSSLGT